MYEGRKRSTERGGTAAISWKDGRRLTIHRKKEKVTQQKGWTIGWGWI